MWMVVVTADSTVLSWTDNVLLLTGSLGYSPKWYAFNFSNTQFILNNIFFKDTDYSLELPSLKTGSLNFPLFLGVQNCASFGLQRPRVGCPPWFCLEIQSSAGPCSHSGQASSSRGFPGGPVAKNLPASVEDTGDLHSIPGSGSSPGGGKGNPLWYPCLDNSMGRGAWRATVCGAAESRTCLSDGTHMQLFSAAGHLTTSAHLNTDPVTFYFVNCSIVAFL